MKIFKTIRFILSALRYECEQKLAYFFGVGHAEYNTVATASRRNVFISFLLFFRYLALRFSLRGGKHSRSDVFFYAGTKNQYESLAPIVDALLDFGVSSSFLLENTSWRSNPRGCSSKVEFNCADVLVCIAVLIIRAPFLLFCLARERGWSKVGYINVYWQSYVYLAFFCRILIRVNPGLIITSNDHNVSNRSLRLVAKILGIKSVYVQHASVSEIFPPLDFDFAFLDGVVSEETYASSAKKHNIHSECRVCLTGQKKVVSTPLHERERSYIGVALNEVDDIARVCDLLKRWGNEGAFFMIRTHPRQSSEYLRRLKYEIHDKDYVRWVDPADVALKDYFKSLRWLIAGDSSVHLEAAIAGIKTLYIQSALGAKSHDYYGYVRNGISKEADISIEYASATLIMDGWDMSLREEGIRKYSSTYGTEWQGKEGELSALYIKKILNGDF